MLLTKQQLKLVNSVTDITLWVSGYGAGSTTALAQKIAFADSDVILLNPTNVPLRLQPLKDVLSPHTQSIDTTSNTIQLTSGYKVIVTKSAEDALDFKIPALLIVENFHLFENNEYKKVVELINTYDKVILMACVVEDKKAYSRRFCAQAVVNGDGFITFDGKYPIFSTSQVEGFSWKSISVIHTNIYDNPHMLAHHSGYLNQLLALNREDRKKAFAILT